MLRAVWSVLLVTTAGIVCVCWPGHHPAAVQGGQEAPAVQPSPPPVLPPLVQPAVGQPRLWSPADAVPLALADVQTLAPQLQPHVRYLDLGNLPAEQRSLAARVLSGHVNGLSRSPEIVRPALISGVLLRLVTKDYRWDPAVYEKLADVDPYFHAVIEQEVEEVVEQEYGDYRGPGKTNWVTTEVRKEKVKRKKKTHASAPWLPSKETVRLIELTQSQTPLLKGDWFFQQTAIQFNRNPGYYDFLVVKDQRDWERLVGFDEKGSRAFADIWREAVSRSGVIVGRRPRRLERLASFGGGIWRSLDSKVTLDRNNPLRVLDDQLKFDATEQLAPLPNGMMGWFLGDNEGVRQDAAPDFIASDQSGTANDSRVHVNLNCVRCHANAGIKDFSPWARTLFQPPRALESPDYDVFLQLRRQYLRHLEPHIEDDRRVYTRAIAESTGLKPEAWASDYYALWSWYIDSRVDLAWAARSLGTTPAKFQAALVHVKKTTGQVDPVLATFLAPEALSISIETWEEAYPIAQLYLRGFVP